MSTFEDAAEQGRRAVRDGFLRFRRQAEKRVERKVRAETGVVARLANELCPLDTGVLRASQTVDFTGTGMGFCGQVAYTAPYAVYVHEDTDARHAPPTRAKFLQAAVEQVSSGRVGASEYGVVGDVGGGAS